MMSISEATNREKSSPGHGLLCGHDYPLGYAFSSDFKVRTAWCRRDSRYVRLPRNGTSGSSTTNKFPKLASHYVLRLYHVIDQYIEERYGIKC